MKLMTISLITVLILSVNIIGVMANGTKANSSTVEVVCGSFEMPCEDRVAEGQEQTAQAAAPSSSNNKFLLAVLLQYIDRDRQIRIYESNIGSEDQIHLRVEDDDELRRPYVRDALSLPGSQGVTFKSSEAIIENAARVKDLGFEFIDFNLEPGLSPRSDRNDVVGAMIRAAQATHDEGLKFRASPSREYTNEYGSQIASFVDYYHIQAQALQGDGVKVYSDYVHRVVSELKNANSGLIITVQVSTQQDSAPGLSLLETMKQCTNAVMDIVDGVSIWYGESDINRLESFVEWYKTRY